jgi:hypothetical protein
MARVTVEGVDKILTGSTWYLLAGQPLNFRQRGTDH